MSQTGADRACPIARHDSARLARYGALAYALVIIYASLNPFAGWRDNGVPIFDFVEAAWPRYWTAFDLVTNVAAYVPLGFLLVPALVSRLPRVMAVLLALLLPLALSGALETLQNFLPSRVPSNVDWACNTLGAWLGAALGARFGGVFADGGAVFRLRRQHVVPGRVGDAGLVLLGLWLMTQMNPAVLLFGHGDLRSLLGLSPALPYSAEGQLAVEWGIAVLGPLAAGLVAREVMRTPQWMAIVLLLVGALVVRGVSAGVILGDDHVLHWATPGNKVGFVIGAGLLCAALTLPSWARRSVAALSLLVGTALANLAPENPYLLTADSLTLVGHFLNFNGLTRLASVLWPFLALTWLMMPTSVSPKETT